MQQVGPLVGPGKSAAHRQESANAAHTFLLHPEARVKSLTHNTSMSYIDLSAARHQRGDPLTLPAVLQTSPFRKDGVLHDWVIIIIIVVALILVSCFLWLFCLRLRSRQTQNVAVQKSEEANGSGNQTKHKTPTNNGRSTPSNGHSSSNSSPPTPVKTPLAVLAEASRPVAEQLCPDLIVTDPEELRFMLMQNIFSWTPRSASKVLDSNGQCIANAVGTCIGNDRMSLRGPTDDLLCEVQRHSLEFPDQNVFDIFHPHGQLFGVLEKDTLNPNFTVTSASGARLLVFQGDFRRKEIDITDPASGEQVAQTGHGFFSCNRGGHYQVRVAPGVDAGLIIACCLAIDEAEF
jgi:uncharacterized protein YxjI